MSYICTLVLMQLQTMPTPDQADLYTLRTIPPFRPIWRSVAPFFFFSSASSSSPCHSSSSSSSSSSIQGPVHEPWVLLWWFRISCPLATTLSANSGRLGNLSEGVADGNAPRFFSPSFYSSSSFSSPVVRSFVGALNRSIISHFLWAYLCKLH